MDVKSLEVWEDIYATGQQLNKAPFDEVVSFVFRHKPNCQHHDINILEVGCGVGNNLKFFSQQGFACHGIDGSSQAVKEAMTGMSLHHNYNVRQGDFRNLPYGDRSFDLVIDRAALWYVDRQDAIRSIAEIARVIRPGGRFLFTPCRENTDDRTGEIRFDTARQAIALLPEKDWDRISFDRVDTWDIYGGYKIRSSVFRIVSERRS